MPIFIHDIIHKLELGSGHRILKIGVAVVSLVALALFYNMAAFQNFATPEAMDAAQLARNISEGKGFTTDVVRPLTLHLLKKHGAAEKVGRDVPIAPSGDVSSGAIGTSRPTDMTGLIEQCPDLSNPPAYPLVLAGVLELMPFDYPDVSEARSFTTYSPEVWIAGFNQLLLVVCACLVFSLARRLFDEPVAWVSATVFADAELFWRHSVSGLPTLWLTFLVLVLAHLLVAINGGALGTPTEGHRRPTGMVLLAVGAGVVAAAAGLTRYALLAFIIPVLGYILTLPNSMGATTSPVLRSSIAEGGRPAASPRVLAMWASLGFLALVVPWMVRNHSVSGTLFGMAPYAALEQTIHFPGDSLMRSLSPSFETMTTGAIGRKVLLNLRELWLHDLPTLGGSWTTALFLAGLVVPFRSVINGRLRIFVVALLAILVFAQAVVSPTEGRHDGDSYGGSPAPYLAADYLTVVAPLVFIFGVSLLFNLLDQFTAVAVRYGILAMFFVLTCAPLVLTFAAPRHSPLAYPPYYPPAVQSKAAYVAENEWMVSDMPWAVAWYGDRKAAWLPLKHGTPGVVSGEDFYALHRLKPIRALHLSQLTLAKMDTAAVAKWRESGETDPDWEAFRGQLKALSEAATGAGSRSGAVTNALVEVHALVDKHWVRGGGVDWESFLLGILVNREVPTGFPLRVAPLGIMPEIFLTDSERPATKTIKLSEQADRR